MKTHSHFFCQLLGLIFWTAFASAEATTSQLAQLQARALQHAQLVEALPRQWQQRVRWKAALPQLRVTVQRDLGEGLQLDDDDTVSVSGGAVTVGPDRLGISRDYDAGLRLQFTALWNLDELVLSRDEFLVSQERRRRQEEAVHLLEAVSEAYGKQQEARLSLLQTGLAAKLRFKWEAVYLEQAGRLNAYTGGWYCEQAPEQCSVAVQKKLSVKKVFR